MKYSVSDQNLGRHVHGKINLDKRYIQLNSNQPRPRYHICYLHEKLHTLYPVPCDESDHKDIVILATTLGPLIPRMRQVKGPVSITESEYNYVIDRAKPRNSYTSQEMYHYIVSMVMWYYKINAFQKVHDIVRLMQVDLQETIDI